MWRGVAGDLFQINDPILFIIAPQSGDMSPLIGAQFTYMMHCL